ncbi:lysophospholipase [Kibdelosporangium philippinense]|uniref:Lysophospholipase n=1 Tax=Kibdelosporangium philippinense TaxID=211113 RepID=A0ABS8ZGG9_9PSEU|nr:alpha/beta fold hydrolase [Kibdelosporangium philippinense]MCE7006914.1 lysophospholipase [Kibdelosporangium philippinense]
MRVSSTGTTVRTRDGLRLSGTFTSPDETPQHAALLVHGAGVTREEGGFFARLANGLSEVGVASVRFDLPGHGESEGRQEDLSLSALLNAIDSGVDHLRGMVSTPSISLIAASFAGGASAYYAAHRSGDLSTLVLINPLIDYKTRFVDEKPAWRNGYISEKAGRQLLEQGYVGHSPTFKLGRPILNEVFWLQPRPVLAKITSPTLIVHGTEDTFISVNSSREADKQMTCKHRLIELDGAQHGIAVHDDPEYADPQTQEWQAFVIGEVGTWITQKV